MEHDIIVDLLPLYYDGVCSEKSRQAVEEHLNECEQCRAALEDMRRPLPAESVNLNIDEAEDIKKFSRYWSRKKRSSRITFIFLGFLLCLIALGSLWFAGVWSHPLSGKDIAECQIYSSPENDAVFIHWDIVEGREAFIGLSFDDSADGRHYYLTRPLLKKSLFKNQQLKDEITIMLEMDELSSVSDVYVETGDSSVLLYSDGNIENFPTVPDEIYRLFFNSNS